TVAWLAPGPPAHGAAPDGPGTEERRSAARTAADASLDAQATLDHNAHPEAAAHLAQLAELRLRAYAGRAEWSELYQAQTAAVAALLDAPAARPEADGPVPPALDRAAELLSRQDALLLAADTSGTLPAPARAQFAEAAAGRAALETSVPSVLDGAAREAFHALGASGAHHAAEVAADRLATADGAGETGSAAQGPRADWVDAHRGLAEGYDRTRELVQRAGVAPDTGPWPGGTAALLLGVLLLAAAVVLPLRAAARLRAELLAVRDEALELARRGLPRAVRRAHAGGTLDPPVDAPVRFDRGTDPVAEVRGALGTVHRAALRGIADTAASSVPNALTPALVRLAHRGRHLADLQLSQLDQMEHRTTDPVELGELFLLDHLATRARRQAELLASLAGHPGAADGAEDVRHRRPVDVEEAARAAQCEIEDYRRVEVRPSPRAALLGHAAGDVTHLLAEVMENATRYSPTHTWVRVTGSRHAEGYVYRIEDRGPGLDKVALAEARQRLSRAAAHGPGDDRRLGLFVAGRLAARHGVRIDLRPGDTAGLTVEVLVPTALLTVPEPCRNEVGDDASLSA
ncbi:ATP-binding protein, partial [Streptomyces spiramenti]